MYVVAIIAYHVVTCTLCPYQIHFCLLTLYIHFLHVNSGNPPAPPTRRVPGQNVGNSGREGNHQGLYVKNHVRSFNICFGFVSKPQFNTTFAKFNVAPILVIALFHFLASWPHLSKTFHFFYFWHHSKTCLQVCCGAVLINRGESERRGVETPPLGSVSGCHLPPPAC